MSHKIALLLCGGTIDKTYFPAREVFDFGQTHIQEIISHARMPDIKLNTKQLMLKDSLVMDDTDRNQVAKACKNATEDKIIITHGTSTMSKTASVIDRFLDEKSDKTIVLFGAMLPYEHGKSDAMFNFGLAVSACQLLPPGIYIAMSGKVQRHDQLVKNENRAVFESTN